MYSYAGHSTYGLIISRPEPPPESPPRRFFALGIDLGKLHDYSAAALLEWTVPPRPAPFWKPDYDVSLLRRWPLGTPYLEVCADVVRLLRAQPLCAAVPLLALDETGVGGAVAEAAVERLAAAGVSRYLWAGITITAGSACSLTGPGRYRVAKRSLVSVLQVALGSRRLHLAAALAEARLLQRELETFSVKITESANESFESWRERDHDDLVLAVALALWAAEMGLAYEDLES
jgi:hypothetical protein